MNEGLKALEDIISTISYDTMLLWEDTIKEDKSIIEKELKDLDTIKKIFDDYCLEFKLTTLREAVFLLKQLQGEKSQCWDNVLKKLEALKIIKNKKVQVAILLLSNSCVGYNMTRGLLGEDLTEEEYDFLKEELL